MIIYVAIQEGTWTRGRRQRFLPLDKQAKHGINIDGPVKERCVKPP
jgi:hypothetical protein